MKAFLLAALAALAAAPGFGQAVVRGPAGGAGGFEGLPTATPQLQSELAGRLPVFEGEPAAALAALASLADGQPSSRLLLEALTAPDPAVLSRRLREAGYSDADIERLASLSRRWSKASSDPVVGRALARVRSGDATEPAPPPKAETVPFRLRIRQSGLYLLETDPKTGDDSNGRLLSASLQDEALREGFARLYDEAGPEALKGRKLYVTGVEMGGESAPLSKIGSAAEAAGLRARPSAVRVLSVPRAWSRGPAHALFDRAVYFLPSLRRDFQRPLRDEIVSDVVTTAILEVPNAIYLLANLPRPDAWLVLGTHAALLSAYTVLQRSTTNWLLRAGKAGLYAKQVLLSLPFVLNYNVFGHYGALAAFHRDFGAAAMLSRVPAELAQFAVTQGLTLLLQTLFYSIVVTSGFRGWAAKQSTPEDSGAARSWVAVLLLPWLWLDSIFLTQAGTAASVLFRAGPFLLTAGHLHLAAWTALGMFAASRTSFLDASLGVYKKLRRRLSGRPA